jgi:hypothetical protein
MCKGKDMDRLVAGIEKNDDLQTCTHEKYGKWQNESHSL